MDSFHRPDRRPDTVGAAIAQAVRRTVLISCGGIIIVAVVWQALCWAVGVIGGWVGLLVPVVFVLCLRDQLQRGRERADGVPDYGYNPFDPDDWWKRPRS